MILNMSGAAAGGGMRAQTISSLALPEPSTPFHCYVSGLAFRPRFIVSYATYPDMIHIGEADIVMVACYLDGVNTHPDEFMWTISDDGFEFYDYSEGREVETTFYISG